MSQDYFDKCNLINMEDNSLREKLRISEAGAAALYKLNAVMKQMKEWKADRANLKRNICQLKTVLQDAGRAVDSPLYTDSFLEYRRNEVKRLKSENEALRQELSEIKDAINDPKIELSNNVSWRTKNLSSHLDIQGGHFNADLYQNSKDIGAEYLMHITESLRKRLLEFTINDQNVEVLFISVLGKAAELIANLCEEVVNVTENLHSTKFSNDDMHAEIDKLKAMLRSRTGDRENYQKRFNELSSLSKELKNHANTLKANLANESWGSSLEYSNLLGLVEQLVNNLKSRLENDRKAMLAAGDPDCLTYLKKIIKLRINLSCLHEGLNTSQASMDFESQKRSECGNKISALTSLLKEVDAETQKLRDQNLLKHYYMNNFDSRKYLLKVEEMEMILRNTMAATNSLKRHTSAAGKSKDNRGAEKLDDLVGKLCEEIKELEMIVLSQDSTSLFKRIEQLEKSVVRLRTELTEKDERANILGEKFSNARYALEQKIKEVKDIQRQGVELAEENKSLKEKAKAMEERILGLRHEYEVASKQIKEVQQVKCEAASLKKKLCCLETDKESQINEIKKVRAILHEKDKQIENIVSEHNSREKESTEELENLYKELQSTLEENGNLRSKIREITSACDVGRGKRSEELIQTPQTDSHQLRIELDQTKRNFDNANRKIIDLQTRLDHSNSDRKRLETDFTRLESNRDSLLHQLEVEKSTGTERVKEYEKVMSENNQLQDNLARAQKEADTAKREVSELQTEKEQWEKLLKELNKQCTSLTNSVDVYKFERVSLDQELNSSKITLEDLKSSHNNTKTELDTAMEKIKRLELENSQLRDNLDVLSLKNSEVRDNLNVLTLKNSEVEARVQVLLTENNDLTTRINELNEANVTLQDQLNKRKEENEYLSIELHKSRAENDKALSEITLLQDTSNQMKRSNNSLKRTNDRMRQKINEIQNTQKALENQFKVLRSRHAVLKQERESLCRENGTLKDYSNKFGRLGRVARTREGQLVIISNAILRDLDKLDNKCKSTGIRFNEKDRQVVKYRECYQDGCRKPESKVKINDRRRVIRKRLRVENEALKFEMTNLRSENYELRVKLSRTKAQLNQLHVELMSIKEYTDAIRPVSNKLEITNLYYNQEISSYSAENSTCFQDTVPAVLAIPTSSDMKDLSLVGSRRPPWFLDEETEGLFRHINQLKIQNITLIKENASLRSYLFIALADREKAENSLQDVMDEILALKVEMRKLREERESLRARLNTGRMELAKLTSEKIAMKDELIILRNENYVLRQRTGELRNDYQKLEQTNAGLQGSLMSAAKLVNKYTINTSNFDGLHDQLKTILEQYFSTSLTATEI